MMDLCFLLSAFHNLFHVFLAMTCVWKKSNDSASRMVFTAQLVMQQQNITELLAESRTRVKLVGITFIP